MKENRRYSAHLPRETNDNVYRTRIHVTIRGGTRTNITVIMNGAQNAFSALCIACNVSISNSDLLQRRVKLNP
jgi:hypothetical protein